MTDEQREAEPTPEERLVYVIVGAVAKTAFSDEEKPERWARAFKYAKEVLESERKKAYEKGFEAGQESEREYQVIEEEKRS